MSEAQNSSKKTKGSWKFPAAFWTANTVELFERAAYYAVFIAITLYLSRVVGFSDIDAGWIGGMFAAGLYFLPPFTGAFADKIGFRKAIILAFSEADLICRLLHARRASIQTNRSARFSCSYVRRFVY